MGEMVTSAIPQDLVHLALRPLGPSGDQELGHVLPLNFPYGRRRWKSF